MAGNARYTALLDACVLYSIAMTDALLSIATKGMYAAKWTTRIEAEWIDALERSRPDLVGKLGTRRDSMRDAVPDWEVLEKAWQPLASGLELPDLGDTHVLAAAIAGHADCIVTVNARDFPADAVSPYGIEVIDPDTFLINQWDLDAALAVDAFREMRGRRRRPGASTADFIAALTRNGLVKTAERLQSVSSQI